MVVYVSMFYRVMHHPEHLVNLLVLYIAPFVYLWMVRKHKPLEFTGLSVPHCCSV